MGRQHKGVPNLWGGPELARTVARHKSWLPDPWRLPPKISAPTHFETAPCIIKEVSKKFLLPEKIFYSVHP